jgi:hypothetical protein
MLVLPISPVSIYWLQMFEVLWGAEVIMALQGTYALGVGGVWLRHCTISRLSSAENGSRKFPGSDGWNADNGSSTIISSWLGGELKRSRRRQQSTWWGAGHWRVLASRWTQLTRLGRPCCQQRRRTRAAALEFTRVFPRTKTGTPCFRDRWPCENRGKGVQSCSYFSPGNLKKKKRQFLDC